MGQEITIKIEGLEELTKAMIVLAGSIQDHTAAMAKGGANIELKDMPGVIDFKKVADDLGIGNPDQDPGDEVEKAVRDMYYYHKATNRMLLIKKGQPLDVPAGFKATTKSKYDEFYGEDGTPDTTGDTAPWESEDESGKTVDGPEGDDEPTVTMEDVRAKFVALDKATEKGAAKKILIALNVDKLMDMDPADYPKALKMAEDALKKAGK